MRSVYLRQGRDLYTSIVLLPEKYKNYHRLVLRERQFKSSSKKCPISWVLLMLLCYIWIADQQDAQKINVPTNQKGYDNSETTDHCWKALGKENSDLPDPFFCDHFLTSYFFKRVKTWSEQK